jgi:hypothetical protein
MALKILYIEDDVIDVLALTRVLRNFEKVDLTVCESLEALKLYNLETFDIILSDSNLPDGGITDLKNILPLEKTQFISGSEISGENVWIKPIEREHINSLFSDRNVINMKYINDLANGDSEYVQEMVNTALRILPVRWEELEIAKNDLLNLKNAAHKTKSSYRVCGIQNQWLTELEELNESSFMSEQKEILLSQVKKQIDQAIAELSVLLT